MDTTSNSTAEVKPEGLGYDFSFTSSGIFKPGIDTILFIWFMALLITTFILLKRVFHPWNVEKDGLT